MGALFLLVLFSIGMGLILNRRGEGAEMHTAALGSRFP